MIEIIYIPITIIIGLTIMFFVLRKELIKALVKETHVPQQPHQVTVNLQPLEEAIRGIPTKVLQSIQSSTNTKKGVLGELIGYIQLEAEYDRIIPLGNIVDFLAISLPKEDNPGKIVFIDVKTGKSARLSVEQRAVRKLIESKRIEFLKLSITELIGNNADQSEGN
jgi:predicted Holliday junction resolvase-like endonuclease